MFEYILRGLKINISKTKILPNSNKVPATVKNPILEYVNEYIYFGQLISFEGRMNKKINKRMAIKIHIQK